METTREELLQAGYAEVDSTTDYSPDRLSQFPSYLKVVIQPLVNYGYHLLPVFKRKLRLHRLFQPFPTVVNTKWKCPKRVVHLHL